jgi:putative NAD(P)-binding protein
MRISCVGGGPAGLYFAILMKQRDSDHEITVFEREPAGLTYGWGAIPPGSGHSRAVPGCLTLWGSRPRCKMPCSRGLPQAGFITS